MSDSDKLRHSFKTGLKEGLSQIHSQNVYYIHSKKNCYINEDRKTSQTTWTHRNQPCYRSSAVRERMCMGMSMSLAAKNRLTSKCLPSRLRRVELKSVSVWSEIYDFCIFFIVKKNIWKLCKLEMRFLGCCSNKCWKFASK